MGDKWTTSGGWRLKAKQNRSFAGRVMHHNRTARSAMVIDVIKNRPTNSFQNSGLIRQRNAGVQGSYSAYADPIARRAVAVSFIPQPNNDNAPDHPIHHIRLRNTIRQRIRNPRDQGALLVQQKHNIRNSEHPNERSYPINGKGQQNPPFMSPAFHGTLVTPSLSSAAPPYHFQPCFKQPMYYSFEPYSSCCNYNSMDLHHRSLVATFPQNNTINGTPGHEAHQGGVARFQNPPTSTHISGTQRSKPLLSRKYADEHIGENASNTSTLFVDFTFPMQLDCNSGLTPSMRSLGDQKFSVKRYGCDLHPNANSKCLFTQKYIQNDFEQGQLPTSTPFQVQPSKLTSFTPQELPFDWVHADVDPHDSQDFPFLCRNDEHNSNAGFKTFREQYRASTEYPYACSFSQHDKVVPCNGPSEDLEISLQKMNSEETQTKFKIKRAVHDDAYHVEVPLCQFHGTMTIETCDNPEPALRKENQEIHDRYPYVRHRKPHNLQQHQIRFFNEGVEVDLENRPLSRPSSLDFRTSSMESPDSSQRIPRASDADLDLAGKTSMWGDSNM